MKYRDSSGRVTNNPYQQLINIKKYNVNFDENLKKTFSIIETKEAQFEIDWLKENKFQIDHLEMLSYYLNFYLILKGLNIKVIDVITSDTIFIENYTIIFNRNTLNVEKSLNLFLNEFLSMYKIHSNITTKKTIKIERRFSFTRNLFLNINRGNTGTMYDFF